LERWRYSSLSVFEESACSDAARKIMQDPKAEAEADLMADRYR